MMILMMSCRRKPRPLSGQAFPASQPSLARRNLHLSTPGSCAKASFRGQQKDASVIGPEALLGGRGRPVSRGGALASTEPTDRRRTTGVSTASANGRARSASPSSPGVSEEAKAGARLALQNYRAAFDLIRQRTSSDSNSHTGWTDDDSPKKEDKVPTSFQAACTGTPSSPANTENDRYAKSCDHACIASVLQGEVITETVDSSTVLDESLCIT